MNSDDNTCVICAGAGQVPDPGGASKETLPCPWCRGTGGHVPIPNDMSLGCARYWGMAFDPFHEQAYTEEPSFATEDNIAYEDEIRFTICERDEITYYRGSFTLGRPHWLPRTTKKEAAINGIVRLAVTLDPRDILGVGAGLAGIEGLVWIGRHEVPRDWIDEIEERATERRRHLDSLDMG